MSTKGDKQFICTLHTQHECSYQRSYHRDCELEVRGDFATASCPFRLEAVVLAAAKPVESPENVVQQAECKTAEVVCGVEL